MARKIIFASGKGGVGKSSLTAGVAIALCEIGFKTLVVDFDIGMGCLDLILAADDTGIFNWGDVINGICEPETALRTTIGPKLLVAPTSDDVSFTADAVKKMIASYDRDFDYILFDAPAGVSGGFLLAAECADEGIIVSTPDDVCVRVGQYAGDKLYSLGIENVRLIINRFNKKLTTHGHYLNVDEVIDATVLQLIGVVPEDRKLSYCSVTGMQTLLKSPAKSAFYRIAKRIEGINVNLVI
ncbi:MAG: P-loop NTPase [Clostridia bacterium]|nr:P-loop NTPase [Clostridia bacterium]MBQ7044207.1 P-loop NTPase [Clostridia bacterium]